MMEKSRKLWKSWKSWQFGSSLDFHEEPKIMITITLLITTSSLTAIRDIIITPQGSWKKSSWGQSSLTPTLGPIICNKHWFGTTSTWGKTWWRHPNKCHRDFNLSNWSILVDKSILQWLGKFSHGRVISVRFFKYFFSTYISLDL